MYLLAKHLMTFPRSPADSGSGGAASADPAKVAAPAAPGLAPAPVVTDPAAPTADAAPAVEPAQPPKPQMVPVTVVAELRGKARSLENELAQARREAADARALAERLTAGNKGTEPAASAPAAVAPAVRTPAPSSAPSADDDVNRRAEYLIFQRDVAAVRDAGMAQYGQQFVDTIRALAAYGADDDTFVSQALAVARGNNVPAHVLLHDLAQDGEKTVALVTMTPTQRIAELTRMAMAQAAAKTTDPKTADAKTAAPAAATELKPAVSKAPAPKPALAPVAAAPDIDPRTPEGNEKMTDAEWEAWYKKTYMRKSA